MHYKHTDCSRSVVGSGIYTSSHAAVAVTTLGEPPLTLNCKVIFIFTHPQAGVGQLLRDFCPNSQVVNEAMFSLPTSSCPWPSSRSLLGLDRPVLVSGDGFFVCFVFLFLSIYGF